MTQSLDHKSHQDLAHESLDKGLPCLSTGEAVSFATIGQLYGLLIINDCTWKLCLWSWWFLNDPATTRMQTLITMHKAPLGTSVSICMIQNFEADLFWIVDDHDAWLHPQDDHSRSARFQPRQNDWRTSGMLKHIISIMINMMSVMKFHVGGMFIKSSDTSSKTNDKLQEQNALFLKPLCFLKRSLIYDEAFPYLFWSVPSFVLERFHSCGIHRSLRPECSNPWSHLKP